MGWERVKTATKSITIEAPVPSYPDVVDFGIATDKDTYALGETMNIRLGVTLGKGKNDLTMHFIIYLSDTQVAMTRDVTQRPGTTAPYDVSVVIPNNIPTGTLTLKAECWAYYPEQPGP